MKTLEDLLSVAQAATHRDEYWSENRALYDRAFDNPAVVSALVRECLAARHFMDNLWAVNSGHEKATGGEWNIKDKEAFHEARKTTDIALGLGHT
jgi:hypothetical protein